MALFFLWSKIVEIIFFTCSKLSEVSVPGDWLDALFLLVSEMGEYENEQMMPGQCVNQIVNIIALKQSTVLLT